MLWAAARDVNVLRSVTILIVRHDRLQDDRQFACRSGVIWRADTMVGMTAQAAFQSWLMYAGIILGVVLALSFGIAVCVVAFSVSKRRDD
jgi:hypothetical protein